MRAYGYSAMAAIDHDNKNQQTMGVREGSCGGEEEEGGGGGGGGGGEEEEDFNNVSKRRS